MQKVVTGLEMQHLDKRSIEGGIPSLVLMENAARGAVDLVVEEMGLPSRVWIVCGGGNNGGDGLAMARHFHNRGSSRVEILLLGKRARLSPDAAANLRMLELSDVRIEARETQKSVRTWLSREPAPEFLVDAIMGTGLRAAARGLASDAIEAILSRPELRVVSVDLPSGLSGQTSVVPGRALVADLTLTFGLPKVPHFVFPAAAHCGKVRVIEISIPTKFLDEAEATYWTGAPHPFWLPTRPQDTHKGNYGRLLIVAGSRGLTGAACLAAEAAVRGGAGLVTVATPDNVHEIIEQKTTESMSIPLPTGIDGGLRLDCVQRILEAMGTKAGTLLIGPGLGTAPSTAQVVRRVLQQADGRVILDADGLTCLAQAGDPAALLAERPAATILTPHPGEMARLLGRRVSERLADAKNYAAQSRSVVVLKGAGTVISNGRSSFVLNVGNPGMASGGTGDVLAGLIGALVAQNLSAFRAAVLGGHLHGLAGDLAAEETGQESLAARDLITWLPQAWRHWKNQT